MIQFNTENDYEYYENVENAKNAHLTGLESSMLNVRIFHIEEW